MWGSGSTQKNVRRAPGGQWYREEKLSLVDCVSAHAYWYSRRQVKSSTSYQEIFRIYFAGRLRLSSEPKGRKFESSVTRCGKQNAPFAGSGIVNFGAAARRRILLRRRSSPDCRSLLEIALR
jgi:hypothetical protein